jgi:hypothetical protein
MTNCRCGFVLGLNYFIKHGDSKNITKDEIEA